MATASPSRLSNYGKQKLPMERWQGGVGKNRRAGKDPTSRLNRFRRLPHFRAGARFLADGQIGMGLF